MELADFQRQAARTLSLLDDSPLTRVPPLLGLASETGEVLNAYRKLVLQGIDADSGRELLAQELGDLLWYIAATATVFELDLNEIAERNIHRTRDRFLADGDDIAPHHLPVFGDGYPVDEQFPRKATLHFAERTDSLGRKQVTVAVTSIETNAQADSETVPVMKLVGQQVGADLTDNSRRRDAYRYHDAIHLSFMAVLHWSPTLRALLKLKRKSDPTTDECEDGARAIYAEEGVATLLSQLARRRGFFQTMASVDGEVLDLIQTAVLDLEVSSVPGWLWRSAIVQGFQAMLKLEENAGGFITADLVSRTITYTREHP